MKIVDEPAAEVETQLKGRGIEVRREQYDPKSRNLVSDFFRFLREPDPGDTVTLWEDERGRVRYYTAERVDPQLAALQARVSELSAPDATVLQPRFDEIEGSANAGTAARRARQIPARTYGACPFLLITTPR